MKKNALFILIGLVAMATVVFFTSSGTYESTGRETLTVQQEKLTKQISTTQPAPMIAHFLERKTVAKWVDRFDKPSVITYVYLVSFGNVLGYYVVDGKPVSTRSYLQPEETFERDVDVGEAYGDVLVSAPSLDGTWGEDNPGIRFFTAEGTAVEWGGMGATYLYSDAPIDFGRPVPKLNAKKVAE